MAKKGIFRRAIERVTGVFRKKPQAPSAVKTPVAPPPPPPAPKVRHATPGERAQAYIDDLQRKGMAARFPKDETAEFWRSFDERGGTP